MVEVSWGVVGTCMGVIVGEAIRRLRCIAVAEATDRMTLRAVRIITGRKEIVATEA